MSLADIHIGEKNTEPAGDVIKYKIKTGKVIIMYLREVSNKTEIKRIKKLYKSAFPKEERVPFYNMKRKAGKDYVEWLNIYDGEEWVGFFYLITYDRVAYLFYYAIDPDKRGKGYGTKALNMLLNKYKDYSLFLAIEQIDEKAANIEERKSRKNFYMRSGFVEAGKKIREAGVVFEVLSTDSNFTNEDYHKLMTRWAGPFLMMVAKFKMID